MPGVRAVASRTRLPAPHRHLPEGPDGLRHRPRPLRRRPGRGGRRRDARGRGRGRRARRGRLRAAPADLRRRGGNRPTARRSSTPTSGSYECVPWITPEGRDERLQPPEGPQGRLRGGAGAPARTSSRTSSTSRRCSTCPMEPHVSVARVDLAGQGRGPHLGAEPVHGAPPPRAPASACRTATCGSTCRTSAAASAARRASTSSRSPSRSPCAAAAAGCALMVDRHEEFYATVVRQGLHRDARHRRRPAAARCRPRRCTTSGTAAPTAATASTSSARPATPAAAPTSSRTSGATASASTRTARSAAPTAASGCRRSTGRSSSRWTWSPSSSGWTRSSSGCCNCLGAGQGDRHRPGPRRARRARRPLHPAGSPTRSACDPGPRRRRRTAARASPARSRRPAMPNDAASSVVLKFAEDATLEILISGIDYGQGLMTVVAQFAAEALDLPIETIRVQRHAPTPTSRRTTGRRSPRARPGRRATPSSARPRRSRRQLFDMAAEALGVPAARADAPRTAASSTRRPGSSIPLARLVMGYQFPDGHTIGGPVAAAAVVPPRGAPLPRPRDEPERQAGGQVDLRRAGGRDLGRPGDGAGHGRAGRGLLRRRPGREPRADPRADLRRHRPGARHRDDGGARPRHEDGRGR